MVKALTIQVPSKFFYEWLEEHYIKLLRVALVRELGKDAKLIYDVRMENTYSSNRPQIVKIPRYFNNLRTITTVRIFHTNIVD